MSLTLNTGINNQVIKYCACFNHHVYHNILTEIQNWIRMNLSCTV